LCRKRSEHQVRVYERPKKLGAWQDYAIICQPHRDGLSRILTWTLYRSDAEQVISGARSLGIGQDLVME
jgi:hypothetical protein